MKRKLLATLLAVALTVTTLSGCGAGQSGNGASEAVQNGGGEDEKSGETKEAGPTDMAADAAKYFDSDGKITAPISEEPVTYTMVYRKPALDAVSYTHLDVYKRQAQVRQPKGIVGQGG